LTYIRLNSKFVYRAVILDKWSRGVVGWALNRSPGARLAVTALERAIAERQPRPGLVHHSDRGIQYASHDYVALLGRHSMTPSMSRATRPVIFDRMSPGARVPVPRDPPGGLS
jgi:putative transposase